MPIAIRLMISIFNATTLLYLVQGSGFIGFEINVEIRQRQKYRHAKISRDAINFHSCFNSGLNCELDCDMVSIKMVVFGENGT